MSAQPADKASGKKPIGGDLVIPVMALLFSLYYLYTIWELTWEAQVNGLMIGSLLIFLVLILLVRSFIQWRRNEVTLGLGPLLYPIRLQGTRLALVALSSLYIVAIQWLGFTLTTFLFSIGSFRLLGVRSWPKLLGIPLLLSTSGYALFILLLNARFPWGPIENALSGFFF